MGARLRCAALTMFTICPSNVSLPRVQLSSQSCLTIDRAACHLVADGLFHRERFAGNHGFFHAGATFDYRAIHWHFVTGNHT